jgi:tetratricopeptide (TPR) repeat protein
LALLTLALFWRATGGEFLVYDDELYVSGNVDLQQAFRPHFWRWLSTAVVVGNWHPLTMLSHALDWRVFRDNPAGHHLTGVIVHCLAVAASFLFLRGCQQPLGIAWLIAALFGWHPLRVESVAWIAERKDVLSALFWMLVLLAYGVWTVRPTLSRYLLVVALLLAGLLAKPMLVTLPFVLLLLDYWPLCRVTSLDLRQPDTRSAWRRLAVEKLPLFGLVLISCAVAFYAQQAGGAVQSGTTLPANTRIANALLSYARYGGKLLFPTHLAVFYPYPNPRPTLLDPAVLLAALLLITISALTIWQRQKRPYLLVGWLWYLGTLVPVIGLVQVGMQAMADRYSYLPSFGLIWALVLLGAEGLARLRVSRSTQIAIGSSIALISAVITWQQLAYWQSSVTLFSHALEVTDRNDLAHNNLGWALVVEERFAEAAAQFRQGIELSPSTVHPRAGLATCLEALGQVPEAIETYSQALELSPNNAELANNLAWLMATHPDPQYRQPQAAIHWAEIACQLTKTDAVRASMLDTLAAAYASAGRYEEAILTADQALALLPSNTPEAQVISQRRALYALKKPYLDQGRAAHRAAQHGFGRGQSSP